MKILEVPFFVYPDVYKNDASAIHQIVEDVGNRGAFILQRDVAELERSIAQYLGIKHVIGVANATDALFMLCRACDLSDGDEVIFCTHTMVATAAGIHFSGATPVPVEAGSDHEIDPESVRKAITSRTKAIMPTQLNGRCSNMEALQEICDEYGLFILEDSAQALGARYKGGAAGSFGRGGVISFYPAKTLGCLGDGGCIVTNDDEVFEKCKLYRDHGRISSLEVVCWCLNSRLDNLQAAILNHKFKKYDESIARRRYVATEYQKQLHGIEQIVLPPAPDTGGDYYDIFQNYEIEADDRDNLKSYLEGNGVGTILPWGGMPVHAMRKLGFSQSLPYTEKMFSRLLLLPMNTSLVDEDIDYVCALIEKYYKKKD